MSEFTFDSFKKVVEDINTDDLLLAFRTITTMIPLAFIQDFPQSLSDANSNQPEEQELRLLSALALLLVREHEIVAVVSKQEDSHLQYWSTANPRRGDIPDQTSLAFADKSPITMDFNDPFSYLIATWRKQTFKDHAQLIISILQEYRTSREPPKLTDPGVPSQRMDFVLSVYVIANCFGKMLRRIKHTKFSTPFLESLKPIEPINFNSSIRIHPPSDFEFFSRLGHIASKCGVSVPYLKAVADSLNLSSKEFPRPYTAELQEEFHTLLYSLLAAFKAALVALQRCKPTEDPSSISQLKTLITNVDTHGKSLRLLAYSSILETHLRANEDQLRKLHEEASLLAHFQQLRRESRRQEQTQMTGVAPGRKEAEQGLGSAEKGPGDSREGLDDVEEGLDDTDIDLEVVQPTQGRPVWEAFRDWIRLMVSYFEASRILLRSLSRSSSPRVLSIKVLTVPPPPRTMWTWKNLILRFISPSDTTKIQQIIDTFVDDGTFNNPPLLEGQFFSGTLHCEAVIASLIFVSGRVDTGINETILREFKDLDYCFGVSKRCCPVCSHLLFVLQERHCDRSFQIPGTHKTVTPCTLPPWLPRDVIIEVIFGFWRPLRAHLLNRVAQKMKTRIRSGSGSADSRGISSGDDDSSDGSGLDDIIPDDYFHRSMRM